eukprot:SAG31_NODE_32392_length_356_cov_1.050584_2_plen_86_part_01
MSILVEGETRVSLISGFTPSGLTFNWADGGTGKGTWLPISLARRYADRLGKGLVYAARQTIERTIASGGCQIPSCHSVVKDGKTVQ